MFYDGASGQDQALSRLTRTTAPDGRDEAYEYDALDRLKKVTYSNGSTITYTYDKDGNLTQRNDVGSVTNYAPDRLNRIQTETYPGYTNTYTYDLNSNLKTLADPSGTTTYGYDDINRQNSITQPGVATPSSVSYRLNPASAGMSEESTTTFPNGVRHVDSYDAAGRMTRTCAFPSSLGSGCPATPSQRLMSFTYSHDGTSCATPNYAPGKALLRSVVDQTGQTFNHCYDDLGRLAHADSSEGGVWDYTLDAAGNTTERVSRNTSAQALVTRRSAYNAANQLCRVIDNAAMPANPCDPATVGGNKFSYDATGNETSGFARHSSSYNARNQLTGLVQISGQPTVPYTYAGPGQSERTSWNGTTERVTALGSSSFGNRAYVRDEKGRPISQYDGTNRYWFLTDRLGSIRAVTNTSGTVALRMDYDPYGVMIRPANAYLTTQLGFAGGHYDTLIFTPYHFGERYYIPDLGRWTQPDPLDQTGDLSEGNHYLYVGGNPVGNLDPNGTNIVTKVAKKVVNRGKKILTSPAAKAFTRRYWPICYGIRAARDRDSSAGDEVEDVYQCSPAGVVGGLLG